MIAAGTLLASRWAKAAGVVLAGVCALAAATSHGASNASVSRSASAATPADPRGRRARPLGQAPSFSERRPAPVHLTLSGPTSTRERRPQRRGRGLVSALGGDRSRRRRPAEAAAERARPSRWSAASCAPADGIEVYRLRCRPEGEAGSAEPCGRQGGPPRRRRSRRGNAKPKRKAINPSSLRDDLSSQGSHQGARSDRHSTPATGARTPGRWRQGAARRTSPCRARAIKAQLEKKGRYKVVLTAKRTCSSAGSSGSDRAQGRGETCSSRCTPTPARAGHQGRQRLHPVGKRLPPCRPAGDEPGQAARRG